MPDFLSAFVFESNEDTAIKNMMNRQLVGLVRTQQNKDTALEVMIH